MPRPSSQPAVVAYRTLGLGDLLTAVPALRALARGFPDHRLVLAAPAWLAPLVALVDAVDEHVAVAELEPVPDRLHGCDVGVNLHGAGPQSHRVLLAAEPRRLFAYHCRAAGVVDGPAWDQRQHEVTRWCDLLRWYGLAADEGALALAPPHGDAPAASVGATVIHPGAKAGARRWPEERFAAVAAHEAARGRPVVVTGSAGERPLAQRVAAAADLPDAAVLAGSTDLAGLARVVAAAGRVVSGDTGMGHLATALGTPSVLLFGPTSPARWGPPDRDRHVVLWAGREGDPLADDPFEGLLAIGVEEVCGALERLDGPGSTP